MGSVFFATEHEIRAWVKEAVKEGLQELLAKQVPKEESPEPFVSRKEIARMLQISLVTLTDWVKRGLPSHKQRGRVYFIHSEVMAYIKEKELRK